MQAEGGDVVTGVRDHREPVGAELVEQSPGELRAAGAAGEQDDQDSSRLVRPVSGCPSA